MPGFCYNGVSLFDMAETCPLLAASDGRIVSAMVGSTGFRVSGVALGSTGATRLVRAAINTDSNSSTYIYDAFASERLLTGFYVNGSRVRLNKVGCRPTYQSLLYSRESTGGVAYKDVYVHSPDGVLTVKSNGQNGTVVYQSAIKIYYAGFLLQAAGGYGGTSGGSQDTTTSGGGSGAYVFVTVDLREGRQYMIRLYSGNSVGGGSSHILQFPVGAMGSIESQGTILVGSGAHGLPVGSGTQSARAAGGSVDYSLRGPYMMPVTYISGNQSGASSTDSGSSDGAAGTSQSSITNNKYYPDSIASLYTGPYSGGVKRTLSTVTVGGGAASRFSRGGNGGEAYSNGEAAPSFGAGGGGAPYKALGSLMGGNGGEPLFRIYY